jgi:DNA primase
MSKKIRCVFHAENTASLVLYKNGFKCFGCGKRGLLKELPENLQPLDGEIQDEEPEDLTEKYQYIDSLPRIRVRGFDLPADERGYYITWADGSYYKYRLFNPAKGGKYLSPRGHRPGLFWARQSKARVIAITEGELNSLSVAQAMEEWAVCSPGSASMFNQDNLSKYLPLIKEYSSVVVILDDDTAGIKGLIESKAFLLYKVPFVEFIQMPVDANEIYESQGRNVLREVLLTLPRK